MLNQRTFNRGEHIYALISSGANKNILIPVSGYIKDIQYNDVNPLYKIRVDRFYDTLPTLRNIMSDQYFEFNFKGKKRKFDLIDEVENMNKLHNYLAENPEKYNFIADGLMTEKHLGDLQKLFTELNDFFIIENWKENLKMQTRAFYKGPFRVSSMKEWLIRYRQAITDKLSEQEIENILGIIYGGRI